MPKNKKIIDITIERMQFPCTGVGNYEGQPVYVKNAIPGQKLTVAVTKRKGKRFGNVISVAEKAPNEIQAPCEIFPSCGGCVFQHISYEDELKIKENMLRAQYAPFGESVFKGLIAAPTPLHYRNKMEFSFGDAQKGGELALGLRKQGTFYEVVIPTNCNIVSLDYLTILHTVLNYFRNTGETFFHKRTHEGSLRHLVIRSGSISSEIFVNLVTTSSLSSPLQPLIEQLINLKLNSQLTGIVHTVNDSLSDAVICDKLNVLHGAPYFHEKLLGLTFKISPFSFFQSNSAACEILYSKVLELIGDTENKTVFDLYCGTGTISQIIARNAVSVTGVEIVPEAVEAAKENAALNNISNCTFIADDVHNFIANVTQAPDIAIVDPPRQGLLPQAVKGLINLNPKRIVYVSCNPVTLVSDLKEAVAAGYKIHEIWGVDLFCRTGHVETCVLLSHKNS